MEKEHKVIIYSIIGMLLLIGVGITYAYFSAQITGNESSATISTTSGTMTIVYDNGSGILTSSNITPDATPFATKTFTVTGNNTTDKIMPYTLSLIIDNNTFVGYTDADDNLHQSLTYSLESVNTSGSGEVVPAFTGNNVPTVNGTYNFGSGYFVNGTNKVHTYTLKIYFLENNMDQSNNMNKAFSAHIGITGGASLSSPKNWNEASTGTLLKAIKDNNTLSNPKTIFGYPSISSEAVMAPAADDYGTSYYFRGNVTNNFVVFANMCWRIVRVVGDGSIKLALYNYNPNSVTNPCDASEDGTSNAFARYSGTTYTTAFYTNYQDNGYVGLMYGNFTAPTNCTTIGDWPNDVTTCTGGSTTYAEAHANINKSTILTNLETWYTSKLAAYSSKLADNIWCNDKSMTSNLTYKTIDGTTGTYSGLGYGISKTIYNAGLRVYGMEDGILGSGPSLICPNDNDGGKLSKFTADDIVNGNGALDYKIGLLTIDEMEMSGYPQYEYYNANETTYYLDKNASSAWYWSSSPNAFADGVAGVNVAGGGWLHGSNVRNADGLRPSVSLISAATISGGTGTQVSPYVVS